jgi:hypothetical protein
MSRNGSGTYSLPEAPFVPSTPISSTAMNSDLSDIADALTDSLSRSGLGGMQTVLSLATSGLAYSADPDTGLRRTAANTQALSVGGQDWTFTATDLTSPTGVTFSSLEAMIGEAKIWCLPTAPSGFLFLRGQTCTSTWPLWRAALVAAGNPFGVSGPDPLFPNFQCRLPAGFDADGVGILTGSTTFGNAIGQQSRTITQANLPDVQLSSDSLSVALNPSATFKAYPNTGDAGTGGGLNVPRSSGESTVTFSPDISGTVPLGGSGTALTTIQPTIIINFIGRAA